MNSKINQGDLLKEIRDISLRNAKNILFEAGVSSNDKKYSYFLYELQFTIYHQLKKTLNIKVE